MKAPFKGLEKPRKLECDPKTETDSYAVFTAEPFERGFGTTFGNSLRRLLLSSITGSAVVAAKFEGIHHEFSTVDGVVEDVSEMILNIKQLIIRKHVGEDKTITLSAEGKGEITAGDLKAPAGVEILNPDLHIATMTHDKASLKVEMVVSDGRGYRPAEQNGDPDWDLDMIPIDTVFSPVMKVTYKVVKTRVEQSSDYDKLILEITTNGSVKPADALAQAAKNLKDHLQVFVSNQEEIEPEPQEVNDEKLKVAANLRKNVDELELSVRSYNCLKNAEIKTILELVEKTDSEMLRTRNFGRKSLNEIKEILEEMGLSLGMNVEKYAEELTMLEQGQAARH